MDTILRLYPLPSAEIPLAGAYLALDLRQRAEQSGRPFLYANFITSVDGRIAVSRPDGSGMTVPKTIANDRDWRLYQELAAQSDILLSSGRYLRDWAAGRAQEILQVDDPRYADLRAWRVERGLSPQPDIAIISGSLDFPIPPVLVSGGRRALIITAGNPDPAKRKEIELHGVQVIVAGDRGVDGALLVQRLAELGYRTIYSAAGPRVLHLLVSAGVLDGLYLTFANRLLGDRPFSSIIEGPLLVPPVDLKLQHIYLDAQALNGLGQLLVSYQRA